MERLINLRRATEELRVARDACNAAHRAVSAMKNSLSSDEYWRRLDYLGDAHRALQRARYAYKQAGGF